MFNPVPPREERPEDNITAPQHLPPQSHPTKPEASDSDAAVQALQYAVDLYREGRSRKAVQKAVQRLGFDSSDTREILDEAEAIVLQHEQHAGPAVQQAYETAIASARSTMMWGGIICLVGTVITLGSCAVASDGGGGKFVVAWGAVIFGGIQFFRGMQNLNQLTSERDQHQ